MLLAGTGRDEPLRFGRARELGLRTANVESEDVGRLVADMTGGDGADVVVEASGSPAAIALGVRLLRRGGRMVVAGITGKTETAVPWDAMTGKAVSVLFSYSSRRRNWDKGLRYLAGGTVRTLPLVTHRLRLEQWQEALAMLDTMESIRTVFHIGPEPAP